jgi:hypothetical protein
MIVESLKYSIPYLFLIFFLILIFIVEYKIRKQELHVTQNLQIIRWLTIGSILFFFGFRGFVGWDWVNYYPAFVKSPTLFSLNLKVFGQTRFESGFVLYTVIIKTIWNNYQFFVFLNTLTDLLILYFVLKQFSRYSFSLSCLVFIAMGGFYLEVDLLRNSKSIMLFLLSLKYLRDRKLGIYLLINIIGCLFHVTAVLFLPLFFFLHKEISRKVLIIIIIVGFIIFLLQIEYIRPLLFYMARILGEKFTALLNKYLQIDLYSKAYGFTIGLLERIFTSLLLIKYYFVLIEKDRNNILFINAYILFFVLFMYFAEIRVIPARVGGLFSFSYWILYPAIFDAIQKKNNKILFLTFIFFYSIVKIAGITNNVFYKYINVLFHSDGVQSRLLIYDKFKDQLLN